MSPICRALTAVASFSVLGIAACTPDVEPDDGDVPDDEVNATVVTNIDELMAALADGDAFVDIEPGDYVFVAPVELHDVALRGLGVAGSDGVNFVVDSTSEALWYDNAFNLSGTVGVENIAFEGLLSPVFYYLGLAQSDGGADSHHITVRECRFVAPPWEGQGLALVGNVLFRTSTTTVFEDNYFEGSTFGLNLLNYKTVFPEAHLQATVARNEFRVPYATLVVQGSVNTAEGRVTGRSEDNVFYLEDGSGIFMAGGTEDGSSPGGSFGEIEWESNGDSFIGGVQFGAITATGGHRHGDWIAPSMGNTVRLDIVSPRFEGCWRDVEILGSSRYATLPANALDAPDETTLVEGNTVEVTLEGADFASGSGTVWIKNDADAFQRFDNGPVPDLIAEPGFGNLATILQTPEEFAEANPGVNAIPAVQFDGGQIPDAIRAPLRVAGDGSPLAYDLEFEFSGELQTSVKGLVPAHTNTGSVADGAVIFFDIEIPSGVEVARFALFDAFTDREVDLALLVWNETEILYGINTQGSNESFHLNNLPAGSYRIEVRGLSVGTDPVTFTVFHWLLGSDDAANLSVDAPTMATTGGTGTVDLTFTGLEPQTKYLGSVGYHDAAGLALPFITMVEITTP